MVHQCGYRVAYQGRGAAIVAEQPAVSVGAYESIVRGSAHGHGAGAENQTDAVIESGGVPYQFGVVDGKCRAVDPRSKPLVGVAQLLFGVASVHAKANGCRVCGGDMFIDECCQPGHVLFEDVVQMTAPGAGGDDVVVARTICDRGDMCFGSADVNADMGGGFSVCWLVAGRDGRECIWTAPGVRCNWVCQYGGWYCHGTPLR